MPQKLYDHPWVEAYLEKKDNLSFWEFIGLIRDYGLDSLGPYLWQAYRLYTADHPKVMHPRLTPELRQLLESEDGHGPLVLGSLHGYNATQRLKEATWQMLHPDIERSQFNKYWTRAMQIPILLSIPEDDRLNTYNIFGRVHKICCDFHRDFICAPV